MERTRPIISPTNLPCRSHTFCLLRHITIVCGFVIAAVTDSLSPIPLVAGIIELSEPHVWSWWGSEDGGMDRICDRPQMNSSVLTWCGGLGAISVGWPLKRQVVSNFPSSNAN